ncbi:LuxR C-terminal-related transcriptional regulator [Streptomyces sp. NPDC058171]
MPLPRLGPEAVGKLLADKDLHGSHADRATAMGAGNPGLLHALPDGPVTGDPDDLAADARYHAALSRWLNSPASPDRRPIALALSAMSTPRCDRPLIATVAGVPARQVTPHHIEDLMALLTPAPVREAVRASAEDHELTQFRQRLARALHENGSPAPDIARILLQIPPAGELWTLHALEEAAEHALRAGDLAHAAAILRHVLSGPVDPAHHCALTLRLSSLEMLDLPQAGTRRLRESLQKADCHDPYSVWAALSGALTAQHRPRGTFSTLEESGHTLEGDKRAVARAASAALATQDPHGWPRTAHEVRELMETAPASVEPFACALDTMREAAIGRIDAHTATQRITSRLDRPVDPQLRPGFASIAAAVLGWADQPDQARALIERELPTSPHPVDPTNYAQQHLIAARAAVYRQLGRFQQLIDYTTPVLESVQDPAVRLPYLRALTAHAWHELGSPERAWQQLESLGPRPDHAAWTWDEALYVRARLHLGARQWDRALSTYLACGATPTNQHFVNPVRQPWRAGAAIALTHLGRCSEARGLAEENLRHAHAWGTPRVIGAALHCHGITMEGHRRLDTMLQAVSILRTAPAPAELIEALTDLGRVQITHGQTTKGQAALMEALHRARSLTHLTGSETPEPTPRLVAGVEQVLSEHNGRLRADRTPFSPALTPTEHRITDLAVQGLTNAEICALLHLSRRTVETHLTNTYRKLGITRRTQLAAGLRGRSTGAALSDLTSG